MFGDGIVFDFARFELEVFGGGAPEVGFDVFGWDKDDVAVGLVEFLEVVEEAFDVAAGGGVDDAGVDDDFFSHGGIIAKNVVDKHGDRGGVGKKIELV